MNRLLAAILFLLAIVAPAWADYSIVQGNGVPAVVKSFTYGGGIGPQNTPVDSTGNPFGTSANPFYITGPGGGVPVTGTFWQATQPVSGTITATQATGSNLHVVCDSGCSSGTAAADEAAFTFGTTSQTPIGGAYQTTATSNPLTNGQMGVAQLTANRALFVNPRNSSGTEIFTSASPAYIQGTVAATESGTWNITNVSGTVSLPTLASTSTLQPTNAAQGSTSSGQTGTLGIGVATTSAPTDTTGDSYALSLNTSGGLRVDGSGVTQPVSGTFWQATQPVSGTFWQTTQPVSIAASIPLPTGAATAALQPTNAAQGSTTSGQTGTLPLAAATTSAPSYTTGQSDPFSLTLAGALRIDGSATTQPVSGTFWQATQPVSIAASIPLPTGAATSANQTNASQKTQIVDGSGNVIASTSNNLDVQCANCSGSGASATDGASFTAGSSTFAPFGGPYQTSATSNPLTAGDQGLAQLTHYRALMTDWFNSGGTEMGTSSSPVQVSVANTGANGTAIAISAASLPLPTGAATAANQEVTAAGSSASSAQGVQGVTGGVALPVSGTFWQTTQPVSLAGISTLARLVSSAASTNLTAVKSSAATLFKFGGCNTTTSPAYVKFYNLASGSVTVGTSAVFLSRELPPDQCSSYDFANGYSFGTAISFAITGGNADSDTTALSAGEIVQAEAAYQ